jgi:hypothetical protein
MKLNEWRFIPKVNKLAILIPAILEIQIWSPRGVEGRSKCTAMHSEVLLV